MITVLAGYLWVWGLGIHEMTVWGVPRPSPDQLSVMHIDELESMR